MDDNQILQILTLTSSIITTLIMLIKNCLPKHVRSCKSNCCKKIKLDLEGDV